MHFAPPLTCKETGYFYAYMAGYVYILTMSDPLLLRADATVREAQYCEARDNLEYYCRLMWPDERPAQHHRVILRAIEDAVLGRDLPRVLIMCPPGAGKSFYGNVRFSSWYRGRFPQNPMIVASNAQELADIWGRRVRNTCQREEWVDMWGQRVSDDSAAVNKWALEGGADYIAVGVGASVVGKRASFLLIDDALRSIEDAKSKLINEKIWDWYRADALTRLKPGAVQVIIATRYSEEDLIGRLVQMHERGEEEWRIIRIPMEAEEGDTLGRKPGERLWPEYFTDEMVVRAKRDMESWLALYQQKPVLASGAYFKREWFRWYDKAPETLRVYGASDYAVTSGGGDYTVHLVAGVDEKDDLYVLDVWRAQTASDVWVDEWLRLVRQWKPLEWAEEKGQIEKSIGPFLDKRQMEERTYCYRRQFASSRDKATRAQAFRARMSQGKVVFPRSAPWLAAMVEEMMAFPLEKSGVHDDLVDTLGLLGRLLASMRAAQLPKEAEKPRFITPREYTFNELLEKQRNKRLQLEA